MQKLFFFHLPKAGGTSVGRALATRFAPSRIAPLIENDVQGHAANDGDYRDFRGFDFYSGHYGAEIFEAVDDGHLTVGNFRHPVARLDSLYRYFREVQVSQAELGQRHYAAVRLAKAASFQEFVSSDDEVVRTYICDQHARQLTGSPWALASAVDLEAAKARVDRLAWYYVCEEAAASIGWLQQVFGLDAVPALNVTSRVSVPDEVADVAELITDRNRLDLALYEHALRQLPTRSHSRV